MGNTPRLSDDDRSAFIYFGLLVPEELVATRTPE
jgi:hypothetical protein